MLAAQSWHGADGRARAGSGCSPGLGELGHSLEALGRCWKGSSERPRGPHEPPGQEPAAPARILGRGPCSAPALCQAVAPAGADPSPRPEMCRDRRRHRGHLGTFHGQVCHHRDPRGVPSASVTSPVMTHKPSMRDHPLCGCHRAPPVPSAPCGSPSPRAQLLLLSARASVAVPGPLLARTWLSPVTIPFGTSPLGQGAFEQCSQARGVV